MILQLSQQQVHFEGSQPLKVVTFNCGKAGLRRRLTEIFSGTHIALRNADILFLQECGLSQNIDLVDISTLSALLGPHFQPHMSGVLTHDAGILFLSPAATPLNGAHGPRWAFARATLRPLGTSSAAITTVDLWSVHGPVRDFSFWQGPWTSALRAHSQSPYTIIGADWNAVPDPARDSWKKTEGSCSWSKVGPTLLPLSIQDVYRRLNPEGRSYTRLVLSPTGHITSGKRLDSIWASDRLVRYAQHPHFSSTRSDHHAVSVSFALAVAFTTTPSPPRRPWALHPGTLRSKAFTSAITQAAAHIGPPPSSLSAAEKITTWQDYLVRLRDVTVTASLRVGKKLKDLREAITALELQLEALDLTCAEGISRLPTLLEKLHRSRSLLNDSRSVGTTNPGSVGVFAPSSWLSSSLQRSAGSSIIRRLRNHQGVVTSDPASMASIVHSFYTALYTPSPAPVSWLDDTQLLLSAARMRITPEDAATLTAPFSMDDVYAALRAVNDFSSPGPLGLTYPLLRITLATTGPHILNLVDGLRAGHPLPVLLQTTLLFKKGDKTLTSNYRPISVSDTALRVVTRMLARRLQAVAGRTLPWSQSAFLPGRRTSSVAGALQGIIDHTVSGRPGMPSSVFLLMLDQQKAYDRVGHSWLWAALDAAGIPPAFSQIIKSLYHDANLQVMINGVLTDLILLRAGLLQGDPLSCVLYNIALQPLLDLLDSYSIGITVPGLGRVSTLAFADDVVILLPGNASGLVQWHTVQTALAAYESASGARLNWNKSGFVEVTSLSHNPGESAPLRTALLQAGLHALETPNRELIHLGHPIHLDGPGGPCSVAFNDRLEAMGTRIDSMHTAGSDLITRVRLSNAILTPKLWHHTSVGGLPTTARADVTLALREFLFLGDRPWFSTDTLSAPRHLGGLGIIHPDHMFTAQSITFLAHNLLREDDYGHWIRSSLAWTLHNDYQCSPAALLIPNGPHRSLLQASSTRASGMWGRLLHALASVDLKLDPAWVHLPGPALLELPWFWEVPAQTLSKKWTFDAYRLVSKRGWITWGDILWQHSITNPGRVYPSWPLGPPGPKAAAANSRPRPGAPNDPLGPSLGTMFAPYWRALPPSLRTQLMSTQVDPFELANDLSQPVPRIRDPLASAFPWHLLLVGTRPLQASRTKTIRLALGRTTPISTAWSSIPADVVVPDKTWERSWVELHECPLPSRALSDSFLWMHRRSWLFLDKQGPLPCPYSSCESRDGQEHSFAGCVGIQTLWAAAEPLLRAMGVMDPVPPSPHLIALGWPDIHTYRPRLILWRTVVLHLITRLRHTALATFKRRLHDDPAPETRLVVSLTLPSPQRFLASATLLAAEAISTARARTWARTTSATGRPQDPFTETWLSGSSFVYNDDTSPQGIAFHRI
ncbi:hypothetical protein CF326_g4656 [Tilletia indica]|nr:hypothetical protein CF326_g4656 [Tilletia indica]